MRLRGNRIRPGKDVERKLGIFILEVVLVIYGLGITILGRPGPGAWGESSWAIIPSQAFCRNILSFERFKFPFTFGVPDGT
jgi:hypothetical protein